MAIRKEEDEAVRRAHAIVDRGMKLQEKKDRKAFCEAVAMKHGRAKSTLNEYGQYWRQQEKATVPVPVNKQAHPRPRA